MKNIVLCLVILGGSALWADESINAQIEALQHASPEVRVAKMNHLKQQIANMNEEQRRKTLEQLQSNQNSSPQRSQFQLKQGVNTSNTNMMQQHLQQNTLPTIKRQGR